MIELLNPITRSKLIQYKTIAMLGDINTSIAGLAEYIRINVHLSELDKAAVIMLQLELLFLNGEVNNDSILVNEPISDKLPQDIRIIIEDNYNYIKLNLFDSNSSRDFYRLIDVRRLAGVQLWDTQAIIAATDAAANNKHYDALPEFWRQYVKTYASGSWRSHMWASSRLAKEYLHLGYIPQAVYYGLIGRDDKLIVEIGNCLSICRNENIIVQSVETVLTCANLTMHAGLACSLFESIIDVIPDSQVSKLFEWIIAKCKTIPQNSLTHNAFKCFWKSANSLSTRLNNHQATLLVQTATDHPLWLKGTPNRAHIIDTIIACVDKLSMATISDLSKKTMLLLKEYKTGFDHANTINLLCAIAHSGNNKIKLSLSKQLYSNDKNQDIYLAQVSHIFDKSIKNIDKLVSQVANNILKQVQYIDNDEESITTFGSFGTIVSQQSGKKVVVQMAAAPDLDVLINHRKSIPESSLNIVIIAIIEMIKAPENIVSNKLNLLNALIRLSDCLNNKMAVSVFEALKPFLLREVNVSTDCTSFTDSQNPLNPFKINTGDPKQFLALILYALACIKKHNPKVYGKQLYPLIEVALNDTNSETREYAFAAAREIPTITTSILAALLVGTRDTDPNVATMAMSAIAIKKDLKLKSDHWQILAYSIMMASQSPHIELRYSAAFSIIKLKERMPLNIYTKMEALEKELSNDACFSIRKLFV